MQKLLLGLVSFGFITLAAHADNHTETALGYVPQGTVVEQKKDEVKIQSAAGGVIEVDFDRKGNFEDASGKVADKDEFNPPNGLITLSAARQTLADSGKNPSGEWSLEKKMTQGWLYEIDGFENGKKMEYKVDAKTGKLISAKAD